MCCCTEMSLQLLIVDLYRRGVNSPKGIADYEECNIYFIRITQNVIAFQLDGLSSSCDDFFSVEPFLCTSSISAVVIGSRAFGR